MNAPLAPQAHAATLAVLSALVAALEADRLLADRLRALLIAPAAPVPTPPQVMTIREYAAHAKVSERTMRHLRNEMIEGVHYHRDGPSGRLIFIHVAEADLWRVSRLRGTTTPDDTLEQLVTDEVAARRAKVAAKKAKARP